MSDTTETKINEIYGRIQTQRKIMEGYQSLRGATPNPEVIRQAEAQIRDAQRNISYLEESLRTLQSRRSSGGMGMRPPGAGPPQLPGLHSTPLMNPARTNSPSGMRPSSTNPGNGFTTPSLNSSGSAYSGVSSTTRGFPGDSSSSYFGSSHGDGRGGSPNSMGKGRYDERPLPLAPADNAIPPPGSTQFGYGERPGGTPFSSRNENWNGSPVNRTGTSARKHFTNLGMCT